MCQICNCTGTRFLTQHLNHVYRLLLFRQMSGLCCGNKVVRISPHVDLGGFSRKVCPETTKELTSAKCSHEGIQLGNRGRQGGSLDLLALELHKGSSGVAGSSPLSSNEDGLTTL